MIGAIAGDMIGSAYERMPLKTTEFTLFSPLSRFTDDSVLTVALADALLNGEDYGATFRRWGQRYPRAGYGISFYRWILAKNPQPYGSWGNGSAMRVSPLGWAFDDAERVLAEARKSAAVSHDHPEGIKGAQATALAVFLARTSASKEKIREEISRRFDYDLERTLKEIRPGYRFDVSCQGSVPEAIIAFLESQNYEEAVRNAVSLGGDSDTMACIAGGVAQAYYGTIPREILDETCQRMPAAFKAIVERFNATYGVFLDCP